MNVASTMCIRSCCATRTAALAALMGCLLTAGTLRAQQKLDPLAVKATDIKAMLRAGEISDEKLFDDFFKKYFFKQFVAPARPYSLDNLPKVRADLKVQYLGLAKAGSDVRAQLNKMALTSMTDVLRGDYGPNDAAIKFNALLAIGDLNEREGDVKSPAKPYAEALPILIQAAVSPKSKDYMRVAGLIGLDRFAAAGAIPPAKVAELTSSLLEMVNQQTPPANRSLDANDWIRRNAGRVLASLGNSGPGNSVVKAFQAIVDSSDDEPMMRCEFAQYLGQLKYPPAAKADFTALANSLGHMTVDICKQEMDSARLANHPPSRRIVIYSLFSAIVGLVGPGSKGGLVAAAAGSPHKEFLDKLKAKVLSLHKSLDDPSFDEETLAIELSEKINELETALVARPTAKLISDKKEKVTEPAERPDGARAAVEPAISGTQK